MSTTISGTGYSINSSNEVNSAPFMYQHVQSTGVAFGTSWVNVMQTPDWKCPPNSVGNAFLYVPIKNDGGSWGGCYVRLYYRINSGGWNDLGHSGYSQSDTVMAYNDGGRIDCQNSVFNFDFSGQTSNFTVGFLVQMLRYNSNGAYVTSCSTTTGGNSTYTFTYDADGNRTASGGAYSVGHLIWLGQGGLELT